MEKSVESDRNRNGKTNLSAYETFIYTLKAFAIFGVVCAHGTGVPDYFSPVCQMISLIIREIGAIGVGIFFFISGFLFERGSSKKQSFRIFIKNKVLTIGVPWVVSATLVYLYVALRKGGNLLEYILSVAGYLSSYWYMHVLIVLYLIFYAAFHYRVEKHACYGFMIAAVVSVLLRATGIIEENAIGVYLNSMNWGIFFSMGILTSPYFENLLNIAKRIRPYLLMAGITIILLLGISGYGFSYYKSCYIPLELFFIFCAISAAEWLKESAMLKYIGKQSFAIYLYGELPWAGLTANICNRFDHWSLVLIRPFIVLGMTSLTLWGGMQLAKLVKKEMLYCNLTGYKK